MRSPRASTSRGWPPRHPIGVTQVVTDGPEGDVTYHFQVGDGAARFGAGPADPEDVRMEQTWDTAVAVATGELNAQEAFIGGRIRLSGDQQLLLESQPVFGALDAVFADRARAHDLRVSCVVNPPMPELPEVQAHAERLSEAFAGRATREVRAAQVHGAEDRPPRARTRPTGRRCAASAVAGSTCSCTSTRSRSSST